MLILSVSHYSKHRNMKVILIIVYSLLVSSHIFCQENLDLRDDVLISSTFTEREIEGLETMIQYVDNKVTQESIDPSINKAYHLFFEKISKSKEYYAPFGETEKYQFLNSLDSVQFSAVWKFETDIQVLNTGDTIYRNLKNIPQLVIKPFSKYMDYLKEVGKEDSYFDALQKNFTTIGSFSLDDFVWFFKNHSTFNFTIPKNRLWAVIYILRMEETMDKKLERYLNIKN